MDTETSRDSSALRALLAVTVLSTIGMALMSVAHAGVEIPVVSALGPGGDQAVPPAAISFAVAAALYGLTALGLASGRSWAWALGLVVNALALVGASVPYRGFGSAVGIALTLAGLALLLSRPVRTSLMPR